DSVADHPTFPNPTIVEALCEVHFVPAADRPWSVTRPLPLFRAVEAQFPLFELVPETMMKIEFGDEGPRQFVKQDRQRIRLTARGGAHMLQISGSGDTFVFNVLRPYPGWEQVRARVLDTWEATREVLAPVALRRVVLRYINRIPH